MTDIALELLFERLLWPVPRVRWEVCRSLAGLIRRGDRGARNGLLDWISTRRLESEVVLGVSLIDAFELRSYFDGAEVLRAIHAPSCLTDWLLRRNFTNIGPLSVFRYSVSPPEVATLTREEAAWFDRYRNSAVPPIFSNRLAHLEESTGFPFLRRWQHDWRWLQMTDSREAAEYPHFFAGVDRFRRGQFDLGQRELYVSAYLRTLHFALIQGILPLHVAESHALAALPMNRGLVDVEPHPTPAWTDKVSLDDTQDIRRQAESLWLNAESDTKVGERLLAMRLIDCTHLGFVEIKMDQVIGRHGFTKGPAKAMELDILMISKRPADVGGIVGDDSDRDVLRGRSPITIAQHICPTYIGRVHIGVANNIRLASPSILEMPVYVRCEPSGICLVNGSRVLSRWVHWYRNWTPVFFPELGSTVSSMTTILQDSLDRIHGSSHLETARLIRVRRALTGDGFSSYDVDSQAFWF